MLFGQKLNNCGAKMSENTNETKFQNKLQIKARLLSAIINLQQNSNNKEYIDTETSAITSKLTKTVLIIVPFTKVFSFISHSP